jgi:hypothetical protein
MLRVSSREYHSCNVGKSWVGRSISIGEEMFATVFCPGQSHCYLAMQGKTKSMEWYEFSHNPQAVTQLFSTAPALRKVPLFEVVLHEDGPRLQIRLNLNDFPERPPARWIRAGYNTVQAELWFWTLTSLHIEGWTTNNIVDVHIGNQGDGELSLLIQGESCLIRATCLHSFRIMRLGGYIEGDAL